MNNLEAALNNFQDAIQQHKIDLEAREDYLYGKLRRNNIFAMEHLIKQHEQLEIETKHYFSLGVYAREIYIPAGAIVVGKLHKHQNLNILTKGVIEVLVDDEIKTLVAPCVVVSPPGTKRIARALEDCIWITVHGTHETDLAKIEDYFIAQTEQEYLEYINSQPLLPLPLED